MLGLKLPTDPRWADVAKKNMEEILTDHAFCEQKAASTAISFIVTHPDLPDLVKEMTALAIEEMSHFDMVHKIIVKRGLKLGYERKDKYVHRLLTFFPKGGSREDRLVNRLLIAGLIEARSCERFRILSENINDAELSKFYAGLLASEARHYTMFLKFARQYGDEKIVNEKWEKLLNYEAEIMKDFGDKELIHG